MRNSRFFEIAVKKILFVAFFAACLGVAVAEHEVIRAFESRSEYTAANEIDKIVSAALRKKNITPARLCSDQVFIRRVYLDITGTLPDPHNVRKFFLNNHPNKRTVLIDELMKHKEFAEYWSLKWSDLLRVKAEFPINLWPNAVQAYHYWIRNAIETNMPYDKFARELLTSSGSNFRVPQVNFYRAIQGTEPESIASAAALTFMGLRLDKLPKRNQDGMISLFSRVGYKSTAEWKEEIVFLDPAKTESFKVLMPDGTSIQVPQGKDPRVVFADWLITSKNQWFAKNIVNRIWAWFFGRGIIHAPDDIRPDNPAVYPEVLDYLQKELVKNDYDLRHIYRLILNSHTYQQSPIPQSDDPRAESMFACYPVRQLDAEVLIDALCKITASSEIYLSLIPEPFSFVPREQRSIGLADGSITSQFLEMFGRPARDTGLESERKNNPTDAQRLHLLNSTHIKNKITKSKILLTPPKPPMTAKAKAAKTKTAMVASSKATRAKAAKAAKAARAAQAAREKKRRPIELLYLRIMSRFPTEAEIGIAEEYYSNSKLNRREAANDLAWALINTKEFLCRH